MQKTNWFLVVFNTIPCKSLESLIIYVLFKKAQTCNFFKLPLSHSSPGILKVFQSYSLGVFFFSIQFQSCPCVWPTLTQDVWFWSKVLNRGIDNCQSILFMGFLSNLIILESIISQRSLEEITYRILAKCSQNRSTTTKHSQDSKRCKHKARIVQRTWICC